MKANNAETPDSSNAADTFKWLAAFVLAAAAVVGNYLYGEMSVVVRAAGVVVLIAAALGVAATTTKGKAAISFAKESRMEVRKVVWPTREQLTTYTAVVIVFVAFIIAVVSIFDVALTKVVFWIFG